MGNWRGLSHTEKVTLNACFQGQSDFSFDFTWCENVVTVKCLVTVEIVLSLQIEVRRGKGCTPGQSDYPYCVIFQGMLFAVSPLIKLFDFSFSNENSKREVLTFLFLHLCTHFRNLTHSLGSLQEHECGVGNRVSTYLSCHILLIFFNQIICKCET